MLRFIKDNMATIDGVEIFPIISLVIFVAFFTGMIWWVLKVDKKKVETMSQLPLKED